MTDPLVVLGGVDEGELPGRSRVRAPLSAGLEDEGVPGGDEAVLVLGRIDLVGLVVACS